MEYLEQDTLIQLPDDALLEVRKEYDLDKPEKLKQAIDVLEEWVKKQNHFTRKDFDREYLERLIIMAKGSVEKAKTSLDKLCTWRTLNPHFFKDVDVKEEFSHIFDNIYTIMLPKLNDKYERVYFTKVTGSGFNAKKILDACRFTIMQIDYTLTNDYAKGYHDVIDFRSANVTDLITNFNPMDLRDTALLLVDGYGVPVKGVHLISESKWMDTLFNIFKQIVSPKIRDRIFVYKSFEDIFDIIPMELFPADYGGKEKSLAEIRADWVETLNSKKFRDYWGKMGQAKTDEALRLKDTFNVEYMGMPGTFKTLSVD